MTMKLGDLEVVQRPDGSYPPLKLMKALAVIGNEMHDEFGKPIYRHSHKDKSKESCILSSLTVRDFLRQLGFWRARVAPVQVFITAERNGEIFHVVELGSPEATGPGWSGHMVVICAGWLIDTTLFPVIRPAWKYMAGMLVVPLGVNNGGKIRGLETLAALQAEDEGVLTTVVWTDDPNNVSWRKAPDSARERRMAIVNVLMQRYDEYLEGNPSHDLRGLGQVDPEG